MVFATDGVIGVRLVDIVVVTKDARDGGSCLFAGTLTARWPQRSHSRLDSLDVRRFLLSPCCRAELGRILPDPPEACLALPSPTSRDLRGNHIAPGLKPALVTNTKTALAPEILQREMEFGFCTKSIFVRIYPS